MTVIYLRKESFLYNFTNSNHTQAPVLRYAHFHNKKYMVALLLLSWLGVLTYSVLVPLARIPFANTEYWMEIKTRNRDTFDSSAFIDRQLQESGARKRVRDSFGFKVWSVIHSSVTIDPWTTDLRSLPSMYLCRR